MQESKALHDIICLLCFALPRLLAHSLTNSNACVRVRSQHGRLASSLLSFGQTKFAQRMTSLIKKKKKPCMRPQLSTETTVSSLAV